MPIVWLARHRTYAGAGLGELLLFDAITTVATAPIGTHAIFTDAIDDAAVAYYTSFGFLALRSRPQTFDLPVATAFDLIRP